MCFSCRQGLLVSLFIMASGFLGCSEPQLELYSLSGTVVRNGQPVKGGGLIFLPETSPESGLIVNASVSLDGTFTAETLRVGSDGRTTALPGVPAGKYRVTYHPASDGSKMGLETTLEEMILIEPNTSTLTITLPERSPEGKGMPRDDIPNSEKELNKKE